MCALPEVAELRHASIGQLPYKRCAITSAEFSTPTTPI